MRRRMKLFAAGHNAWNQLSFNKHTSKEDPEDLFEFQVVLRSEHVQLVTAGLSYTIVRTSEGLERAGALPLWSKDVTDAANVIVNGAGEAVRFENDTQGSTVQVFTDFETALDNKHRDQWIFDTTISQVVAYDVGWVILFENGSVSTLGDPRFAECLGREITAEDPAEKPAKVHDLVGLGESVQKVAAGGYTIMALTQSGSLYAWGARAPGSHRCRLPITNLNGIPNYVEVDGDVDIQDIALGESHAVALSTGGDVYVLGGNGNGQLGVGRAVADQISSWTKLDISLSQYERAIGVAAGVRSSFLLAEERIVDT